jgi:hypothetical protein
VNPLWQVALEFPDAKKPAEVRREWVGAGMGDVKALLGPVIGKVNHIGLGLAPLPAW